MPIDRHERIKQQNVLFVDFNGVISYKPFWVSLQNPNHNLHSYYSQIEKVLFKGEEKVNGLVEEWMLGNKTSEQIHKIIEEKTGVPYDELFEIFITDCKLLDISKGILENIQHLRKDWYCILRTDNMDSFERFTLPANPQLSKSFDEIHSSHSLHQLKRMNGGLYFTKTLSDLGINIKNSVLIDDGDANCEMFRSFGGKAYCTKNETDAINVLKNLSK